MRREVCGDQKCISMVLPSSDAADYLNFVLKDASTNTWYDSNGSNFQLALRTSLRSFMSMDDAEFVRTCSPMFLTKLNVQGKRLLLSCSRTKQVR